METETEGDCVIYQRSVIKQRKNWKLITGIKETNQEWLGASHPINDYSLIIVPNVRYKARYRSIRHGHFSQGVSNLVVFFL
jgi:hypothetical protein